MAEDTITQSEKEELEALRKEKAEGKLNSTDLTLKVSQKGAVSLYGLGRFPVTLYKEQWERVIPFIGQIQEFIKVNEGSLKTK